MVFSSKGLLLNFDDVAEVSDLFQYAFGEGLAPDKCRQLLGGLTNRVYGAVAVVVGDTDENVHDVSFLSWAVSLDRNGIMPEKSRPRQHIFEFFAK
jgi:hypothetical protein